VFTALYELTRQFPLICVSLLYHIDVLLCSVRCEFLLLLRLTLACKCLSGNEREMPVVPQLTFIIHIAFKCDFP
jgi:hypothetical protein